MLYEEFEKLNCKHIQELNKQNAEMSKIFDINDVIMNPCVKDKLENDMLRRQFDINGSCVKRSNDTSDLNLCGGYDCSTDPFYQTPDKLNTYHNYLVLQDDMLNDRAVVCTENHQHYRNWTRRKNGVIPDDKKENDMTFFDKYLEKIPQVKFNTCSLERSKYTC